MADPDEIKKLGLDPEEEEGIRSEMGIPPGVPLTVKDVALFLIRTHGGPGEPGLPIGGDEIDHLLTVLEAEGPLGDEAGARDKLMRLLFPPDGIPPSG
jgi:hypothetical protein